MLQPEYRLRLGRRQVKTLCFYRDAR